MITGITRTTPRWLDLIRGRKVERHTRSDVGKFTGRINHTDHHPTGRFARSFPPCTDHVNHRQNDSSTPDQLTHSLTSSTFTFQTRQGCQPRGYTRLYPPNPIANLPPNSPDSYFREKKKKRRKEKKKEKKKEETTRARLHGYAPLRWISISSHWHGWPRGLPPLRSQMSFDRPLRHFSNFPATSRERTRCETTRGEADPPLMFLSAGRLGTAWNDGKRAEEMRGLGWNLVKLRSRWQPASHSSSGELAQWRQRTFLARLYPYHFLFYLAFSSYFSTRSRIVDQHWVTYVRAYTHSLCPTTPPSVASPLFLLLFSIPLLSLEINSPSVFTRSLHPKKNWFLVSYDKW